MAWGYRSSSSSRSSSYYSSAPRSAWQTAGETMSMNNAIARYGLTEQQIIDAKLECQWRTSYGNSYAVLKCSDLDALKTKLDKEKADKKEQALIDKYGKEKLARMRQEAKEKKEKEAAAAKAKQERNATKREIRVLFTELLQSETDTNTKKKVHPSTVAKTAAKSEWCINDKDIATLSGVKEGRFIKYKLEDVIRKSVQKHGKEGLKARLEKKKDQHNVMQLATFTGELAAYQKQKILSKLKAKAYPQDLLEEAYADATSSLQEDVDESKKKLCAAEKRLRSFEALSTDLKNASSHPVLADSTNNSQSEDDSSASPAKKAKRA